MAVMNFKLTLNPFTLVSTCILEDSTKNVRLDELNVVLIIIPTNVTASRRSFMSPILCNTAQKRKYKFLNILYILSL